jgi:hypothetical protein
MTDLKVVYTREECKNGKWLVKEIITDKEDKYKKLVDRAKSWVPMDRNHFDLVRVTSEDYYWHEVATSKDGSGVRITIQYKA